MEENKRKMDKKTLIIVGVVLLLVVCRIIYILVNNNKITPNDIQDANNNVNTQDTNNNEKTISSEVKNSTIDIQKYVNEKNTTNDLVTYNIDLYNVMEDFNMTNELLNLSDYNITLAYKIKTYDIKLKLTSAPYEDVITFDMYVNDTLTSGDGYKHEWEPYFTMYTLGNYLINMAHFVTDIDKSFHIINVTNGTLKDTHMLDLDNIEGMRIRNININETGIVVDGSRIYHGPSVHYGNNKYYEIVSQENCRSTLNELSNDLIVVATYTYKYENGALNLTPEISDKVTLKEYIDNTKEACNQE